METGGATEAISSVSSLMEIGRRTVRGGGLKTRRKLYRSILYEKNMKMAAIGSSTAHGKDRHTDASAHGAEAWSRRGSIKV